MSRVVSLPNHKFYRAGLVLYYILKLLTSIVHILLPDTDNSPSWISGKGGTDYRKYFMISPLERMLPSRRGSIQQPPDHQSDVHLTEPLMPALPLRMNPCPIGRHFFLFGFYGLFKSLSIIKGGRKKKHLTIRKQNLAFPHDPSEARTTAVRNLMD